MNPSRMCYMLAHETPQALICNRPCCFALFPAPRPRSGSRSHSTHGLEQLGLLRPHHRRRPSSSANATVLGLAPAVWLEVSRDRRGMVHGQIPSGHTLEQKQYLWDGNGHPDSCAGAAFPPPPMAPDSSRWPIGCTRKGLKFGIHIVRGVPRQVVKPPTCPSRARDFMPPTQPTQPLPAPGMRATGA
jgi:hypothetical protein